MDNKKLIESMKKNRLNWDTLWQEVADRCLTDQADFNVTRSPGERRTQRVFDSTAQMAVNRSASAISGLITPSSQKWHTLSTDNDELNKDLTVRKYFDDVTRILFAARYSNSSGFPQANNESLRSLMALGSGVQTINEHPSGRGLIYQSMFMGNIYFAANNYGRVDTCLREFKFNKSQAIQQWGEDNLPDEVKRCKDNSSQFTFYHLVYPNMDYVEYSIRPEERQFKYVYCMKGHENKQAIEEGGYYEFPYAIARDVTSPNEIYGRSPAIQLLPEIKGLNEMRKTVIKAAHKLVDPPLLAPSQGNLAVGGLGSGGMRINMQPNAVTYGGVDAQGRQLIQPLQTGARPDVANMMINESRQTINDGFLLNLFQVLVETPTMTATEVLARTQEKGILLAPVADRLQSEYLGVMIERELGILERQMMLPEIPQALIEAGGEYTIRYDSPITRAQRSDEAIAITETVNFATQAAAFDPSVMDNIDFDKAVKEMSEIRGAPASILRDEDSIEEIRQGRAAQQEQQAMLEQAPALAGAAVDLAKAQEMGGM